MQSEEKSMWERERIESELHGLRQQLDEAWWNEDSLDRIQQLEQEIESRRRLLESATSIGS